MMEIKELRNIEELYEKRILEGYECRRNGAYPESKEKYIEAIRYMPEEGRAYYYIAKVLYITKDYSDSVKAYKKAYELGFKSDNLLVNLGHALIDSENAEGEYSDVVKRYDIGLQPAYMKINRGNRKKIMGFFKEVTPDMNKIDKYDKICEDAARKELNL